MTQSRFFAMDNMFKAHVYMCIEPGIEANAYLSIKSEYPEFIYMTLASHILSIRYFPRRYLIMFYSSIFFYING